MNDNDIRNLITGKDGQVYVTTSDGNQLFLAEVDTFSAQLNASNVDFQPVGSSLVYAVPTGYTVNVTLTEAIIRDDVFLTKFYEDLANGYMPQFDFQGKLKRRDAKVQRQVFRNCLPDGSVDLMNITPGEILKRNWTFRVNATPELISHFNS